MRREHHPVRRAVQMVEASVGRRELHVFSKVKLLFSAGRIKVAQQRLAHDQSRKRVRARNASHKRRAVERTAHRHNDHWDRDVAERVLHVHGKTSARAHANNIDAFVLMLFVQLSHVADDVYICFKNAAIRIVNYVRCVDASVELSLFQKLLPDVLHLSQKVRSAAAVAVHDDEQTIPVVAADYDLVNLCVDRCAPCACNKKEQTCKYVLDSHENPYEKIFKWFKLHLCRQAWIDATVRYKTKGERCFVFLKVLK